MLTYTNEFLKDNISLIISWTNTYPLIPSPVSVVASGRGAT